MMNNQLNRLISEYRSLQPFNEDCKKKLDKKFRLEFNYNSNHLEGNTLTYGETELLLIFDQTKGNHELRELEEMKAHDVALMIIKEEASDKNKPLTEKFIKDLNQTILVRPFWKEAITTEGHSTRRQIKVGEYKEYPNSVVQANGEIFEYATPQDTPILMAELVKWYNEESKKSELSPIELAALLHYRYIRIHPFDDGNGRVARLLVNYVLYHNDLPPVIIKTADKKNYLHALQQADVEDLQAFINYMTKQLAWSLDLSIKAAKGENVEEQDDWEKQLSLLKKGLGDKSKEIIVKKSDIYVAKIYEEIIIPFVSLYDNKLEQFDSLFLTRESSIELNNNEEFGTVVGNSLKTSLKSLNNNNLKEKTKELTLKNMFSTLREPFKEVSIETITFRIILDENAYALIYNNKKITKLYSDILTEKEMNAIISDIGKDLLQKIEKFMN
ncbi:MAG: Fic family protein [Prevotella sp.]|jgi:Fic family protein|nr:Fic family protein [Prevotella sp.]